MEEKSVGHWILSISCRIILVTLAWVIYSKLEMLPSEMRRPLTRPEKYTIAETAFEKEEYKSAAEKFEKLGDYKDSKEKAHEAIVNYYSGIVKSSSGSNIPSHWDEMIEKIEEASEYVPDEAKKALDAYYQMGLQLYEDEKYQDAFILLAHFQNSCPDKIRKLQQIIYNQGIVATGETSVAAINRDSGLLMTVGCEDMGVPNKNVRSVDISPNGDICAVVTAEGKAEVYSKINDYKNLASRLPNRSDYIRIKISNCGIAAMTENHTVYAYLWNGMIMGTESKDNTYGLLEYKDAVQFSLYRNVLTVTLKNGKAVSSNKKVDSAIQNWQSVEYVAGDDTSAIAVTNKGKILSFNTDFECDENVSYVAAFRNENGYQAKELNDFSCIAFDVGKNTVMVSLNGSVSFSPLQGPSTQESIMRNGVKNWNSVGYPPMK